MHFENHKKMGLGNLLKHIEREDDENNKKREYKNDKIDKNRTHLNYSLVNDDMSAYDRLKKRLKEVEPNANKGKIRKDANVLTSVVVTLPRDREFSKEEKEEFFKTCKNFLDERFGSQNCIYANVHLDETQGHLHYGFCPCTKNNVLSCKRVVSRTMLLSVHRELQQYLNENLSYSTRIVSEDKELFEGLPLLHNKDVSQMKYDTLKEEYNNLLNDYDTLVDKANVVVNDYNELVDRMRTLSLENHKLQNAYLDERLGNMKEFYNEEQKQKILNDVLSL